MAADRGAEYDGTRRAPLYWKTGDGPLFDKALYCRGNHTILSFLNAIMIDIIRRLKHFIRKFSRYLRCAACCIITRLHRKAQTRTLHQSVKSSGLYHVVERTRLELVTPTLPVSCAPNCANAPQVVSYHIVWSLSSVFMIFSILILRRFLQYHSKIIKYDFFGTAADRIHPSDPLHLIVAL